MADNLAAPTLSPLVGLLCRLAATLLALLALAAIARICPHATIHNHGASVGPASTCLALLGDHDLLLGAARSGHLLALAVQLLQALLYL